TASKISCFVKRWFGRRTISASRLSALGSSASGIPCRSRRNASRSSTKSSHRYRADTSQEKTPAAASRLPVEAHIRKTSGRRQSRSFQNQHLVRTVKGDHVKQSERQ